MATISRKFRDISLSFARNPVTNDIIAITDADAIKRSVINLVRTRVGERFYNNILGTNTSATLFENQTSPTAYNLQVEIETLLKNFEPRIRQTSVLVTYTDESNDLNVRIAYDIVGLPIPTQTIDFILQPTRI